jgi:hypothetical protein
MSSYNSEYVWVIIRIAPTGSMVSMALMNATAELPNAWYMLVDALHTPPQ